MRKSWILAGLASITLLTAAEGAWPSWLDWLFGRRERSRAAIERTSVKVQWVCAENTAVPAEGSDCLAVLLVSEQYTIRWNPDNNGAVDSLLFSATATGQPIQVRNSAQPQFPVVVSVAWLDPNPGNTITTQACARVKRRSLYSQQNCSASRSYTSPDVPPPPPVIDTTLLAIDLKPDVINVPALGTKEICVFLQFGDGQRAVRSSDRPECDVLYQTSYPDSLRRPAAVQQAVADTKCFTLSATGGRITSANNCDTIVNLPSVGNLQRLTAR